MGTMTFGTVGPETKPRKKRGGTRSQADKLKILDAMIARHEGLIEKFNARRAAMLEAIRDKKSELEQLLQS